MLPRRPADAGYRCLIFVCMLLCLSTVAEEHVSRISETSAPASEALSGDEKALSVEQRALSVEQKGRAIFSELDRRSEGYIDLQVDLEMVLVSKSGKRSHRALSIKQLENLEIGDRVLIRFDAPRDIKGTALLSKSNGEKPEDQWLYLPAFNRVKKIAMKNRSGPFVGSEFSFEDLSVQEIEDYNYRFIESADLDGAPCFVVDIFPKDEFSAYSVQRVWVDQAEYRIQKIDYFDLGNNLLKTLSNLNYVLYQDKYWKAQRMLMINHKNKRSTELNWQSYRFATGLRENRDFTTNSLKRAR